jgi:hypothetical protein
LAHTIGRTPVETPWSVAILDSDTRGSVRLKFGVALIQIAADHPAVHKLTAEVQNLLKPRSVYLDPALMQRALAVMAEE